MIHAVASQFGRTVLWATLNSTSTWTIWCAVTV